MTDIATTAKPAVRLSARGITGYLLIAFGLVALWNDATVLSGLTVLGLQLAAAGTLLVVTVLRRQVLRRTV